MIQYPVFEGNTCNFEGLNFVRNEGPNFVNDGLVGWIQFDENDSDTLKYVVHEITQNTRTWEFGNVFAYEAEYYKVMDELRK